MAEILRQGNEEFEVLVSGSIGDVVRVKMSGVAYEVKACTKEGSKVSFVWNDRRFDFSVAVTRETVLIDGGSSQLQFDRILPGAQDNQPEAGDLVSRMPGRVLRTLAEAGCMVEQGQPLLIIEAMKMEHSVCAPQKGVLRSYLVHEGQRVAPGQLLASLEPVNL